MTSLCAGLGIKKLSVQCMLLHLVSTISGKLRAYCPNINAVIQIQIHIIYIQQQPSSLIDSFALTKTYGPTKGKSGGGALAAARTMGAYDDFSIMYRLSPISEIRSFYSIDC